MAATVATLCDSWLCHALESVASSGATVCGRWVLFGGAGTPGVQEPAVGARRMRNRRAQDFSSVGTNEPPPKGHPHQGRQDFNGSKGPQ